MGNGSPVVAVFLHAANVLRGQINRNASWSGTHRRTGNTPSPPPTLFPSSSTGEMAFVLVHSAVHHSGTKRLNQVARSNSPWGFDATEKRDYSLTALVLQRPPLWYCAMRKPFTNAFPQCKAALPPWDSCHGGRGIQESTRHVSPICWICPMWKKNGKREITFWGKESHYPRKCTSVWDNLAFKIDASLLLFGFLYMCRCHRHGSFKYFTPVQLSHPHQWFNDIDSLRQSKHHVVAPTCRGCSSWYARLVFLAD